MARYPRAISTEVVENVSFSTALHGYDVEQVDDLFDRITETLIQYESGLELRSHHMTAHEVIDTAIPITMPGYEVDEIDGLVDWVVWTLRRYESGHTPDRGLMKDRRRKTRPSSDDPAASTQPVNPTKAPDDPETLSTQSRNDLDDLSERRPMTSEELLEQAKKWMNR